MFAWHSAAGAGPDAKCQDGNAKGRRTLHQGRKKTASASRTAVATSSVCRFQGLSLNQAHQTPRPVPGGDSAIRSRRRVNLHRRGNARPRHRDAGRRHLAACWRPGHPGAATSAATDRQGAASIHSPGWFPAVRQAWRGQPGAVTPAMHRSTTRKPANSSPSHTDIGKKCETSRPGTETGLLGCTYGPTCSTCFAHFVGARAALPANRSSMAAPRRDNLDTFGRHLVRKRWPPRLARSHSVSLNKRSVAVATEVASIDAHPRAASVPAGGTVFWT